MSGSFDGVGPRATADESKAIDYSLKSALVALHDAKRVIGRLNISIDSTGAIAIVEKAERLMANYIAEGGAARDQKVGE